MKSIKKVALSLIPLLAILLGMFFQYRTASALTSPPTVTIKNAKFVDAADITASINGASVTFYDKNTSDSTRNFQPQGMDSSIYCNYGTSGNQRWGINVDSNADLTASTISATIGLGYWYTSGNVKQCQQIPSSSISPSGNLSISSPNSAAAASYKWQGSNIVYVNGGQTFQPKPASDTTPYINESRAGTCEASGIILLGDANNGTKFDLGTTGRFGGGSVPSSIAQYLSNPNSCSLTGQESINIGGTAPSSVSQCGYNTTTSTYSCTTGSGSGSASSSSGSGSGSTGADTCELKSNGLSLAWLLCPALEAADVFATNLMRVFEDQLPFCIPEAGAHCTAIAGKAQDLGSGQNQVKDAWSIMKNLASAVLIIVMLVIVISQALGEGIIDAYSMRKMLPRLVAAAIIIQLSWIIAVWIIDLVNDIGVGLGDLMAAPFGGAQNLSFNALISQALGNNAGGLTSGIFIGYLGGILGLAIGVAFLPSLLVAAFTAVLTLITGLAVLVFRKILIILLLIFSPIALISWILPIQSTQRLWKMWNENFTKALAMFPLVVAMIETGRIFAHITGATNAATGSSFVKFWFVMAGYFLPLFILPRAYKWGGSMMSAAGSQLGSFQGSVQKVANQPLKDWAKENTTDKWANNYNPLKKTLGSRRLSSALQSIKGGRIIPTKAQKAKMIFRGQQWSSTQAERNDALRNNFVRRVQEQGMSADMVQKYDKMAREKFHQIEYDEDGKDTGRSGLFSKEEYDEGMRPNAVGSGKKASQVLAMDATVKGDSELLKSIGRYNVQSKSLLELAEKNFVFPQMDPVSKQYKMVPFWDWRPLVDQTFKDPSIWADLGGMRPDLTPNNVPRGGGRYHKVLAKAGFRGKTVRDINGRNFEVRSDAPVDPRYVKEFEAEDGSLRYRPYLMQKLQALDEDTQGIIQKGGNTLLTFANEITGWTKGDGYYGEGRSELPAEEFAKFIVKQASSEAGLHAMASLKSTPAHVEAIDNALQASGIKQFRGADGEVHDLTVDNIFEVNERAFAKMHADASYEPAKSEVIPPEPEPEPRPRPTSPPPDHPDERGYYAPHEPNPSDFRPPDEPGVRYYSPSGSPESIAAPSPAPAPATAAPSAAPASVSGDDEGGSRRYVAPSPAPVAATPASTTATLEGARVTLNLAPDQPISLHGANVNLQGVQAGQGADMYERRESESMRNELREIYLALKKMGVRSEAQQQQFEQLRKDHPDWDQEEGGPGQHQT